MRALTKTMAVVKWLTRLARAWLACSGLGIALRVNNLWQ